MDAEIQRLEKLLSEIQLVLNRDVEFLSFTIT
jgi:hypothetical protein